MSDTTLSTSLHGKLTRSSSGWILLTLPVGIQRGLFQALHAPGAELPRRRGRVNCHVSVMRPEELADIGDPTINEVGKSFPIQLGPLVETNPMGWDEMDRVWFVRIKSPELTKLRRSYGLSDLPMKGKKELPFHMTVAVRRKGVLRQNDIIKTAEDEFEDSDPNSELWDYIPKVAVMTAAALQDHAANQAFAGMKDPVGSSTIERLGALAQLWDGQIAGIPNKPSALASMLVLGMLGGGLGYSAGRISSGILNRLGGGQFTSPKRMGRTGAALGAAAGLIPGILYAAGNAQAGKPILTGAFLNDRKPFTVPPIYKRANAGAVFDPEHFAKLLNEEPMNRASLTPKDRAMATGLVLGAKHLPGRSASPLITPLDVARMAAGMGSGYLSGSLVGNIFGNLMGLPQAARDRMIQAGTFAGTVRSALPLVFE